jgi:peptidoglycan hydrolase-like protein with peptidoglycan-binding domain
MECPAEDLIGVLLQASQLYTDILTEYCRLWLRSELTDEEADRMEAIYTKAASDPLLDFFTTEFDRILSERVGLLDDQSIQSYKNQQAWLREHLEQVPFEQESLVATQKFLKEAGFYEGPVDGVWGDRARKAATKYRKEVQKLLQQKGLYDGVIDGELGNRSVSAVQAFQKSHNLKHDGVPGRQTFCALQD